jgi:chlorobactene glucosyltransferase
MRRRTATTTPSPAYAAFTETPDQVAAPSPRRRASRRAAANPQPRASAIGRARRAAPTPDNRTAARHWRRILRVYHAISFAILAAMALIGVTNLRTLAQRRKADHPLPAAVPRVSVLVPARNEAANIAACVESLARQDYPPDSLEILVLDDRSTDNTAALVAHLAREYPRVRLLHGADLPPGWGGKAHACQQLVDAARGDWFLFVDADTIHAPDMLRHALGATLAHRADAATALPRERAESFGERLLVPHLFFYLLALQPLPLLESPGFAPFIFANGQFFLIHRKLYRRIGGHAAVRDQLMEDLAIGHRCKRAGEGILLLDGGDWVTCRMYASFPAAWRGFIRSLQAGSRLSPPYLLGIGSLTILYFVGPFALLVALLLARVRGQALALTLAQIATLLAIRAQVGRGLRQPAVEIALFPPAALVLSAAVLTTAYRAIRRQPIEWRGRAYGRPTP